MGNELRRPLGGGPLLESPISDFDVLDRTRIPNQNKEKIGTSDIPVLS